MKAGRLILASISLLAIGLAAAGCQQVDPLRQGVHSTYKDELRQLAEETSRKNLAKTADDAEETVAAENAETSQINAWQGPSLLNAVHLRPPVPLEALPLMPQ